MNSPRSSGLGAEAELISQEMALTASIPSSMEIQPSGGPTAARGPWIYKPWVDLLIGCGGWSAPLLLLTTYVSNTKTAMWSFAFYFRALLFNYPHFMATIYRAYHYLRPIREIPLFYGSRRFLTGSCGAYHSSLVSLAALDLYALRLLESLALYGAEFRPPDDVRAPGRPFSTSSEWNALHHSFLASYLLLLFSFQTSTSGDPLILSLGLPARFTLPARVVLTLFFVAASGWALSSLARRSSWKALLPSATLVTTQFPEILGGV